MTQTDPDATLREAVAAGTVPGVVAGVTSRRETILLCAHGTADAQSARPLRPDSVFRLGSMTKIPTSLAVLALVADGKVDLDRPFADYVPGYVQPPVLESFDADSGAYKTRRARHTVTVRRLLTHTSGYGYWFLDPPLLKLTGDVPEVLNPPFLMHEPGERFAYSTSTDVLGQIFEPLTGRPLAEYLHTRIFAPLGMHDTGYDPPADGSRLVSVHRRRDGGFAAQTNEVRGPVPTGGRGMYGTASDYLSLLRVFLNDGAVAGEALVPPTAIAAMTRDQIGPLRPERQRTALPSYSNDFLFMNGTQTFGFGFLIETRDRPGGRSAGSFAWGGIFNTYFWVDPAAGLGAVLMMQLAPFCDPGCIELLDRFERAVYAQRQNRNV
jgi:methyl acetate hydrolase